MPFSLLLTFFFLPPVGSKIAQSKAINPLLWVNGFGSSVWEEWALCFWPLKTSSGWGCNQSTLSNPPNLLTFACPISLTYNQLHGNWRHLKSSYICQCVCEREWMGGRERTSRLWKVWTGCRESALSHWNDDRILNVLQIIILNTATFKLMTKDNQKLSVCADFSQISVFKQLTLVMLIIINV